jgi:hypothetical protein
VNSEKMSDAERAAILRGVERRETERAKAKAPAERDLMETLLAADVPFERAVSLIADSNRQAALGTQAEFADLIRENRMPQFPKDSEVYRRLGMIADMLDPLIEGDPWKFGTPEGHASR